MCSLNVCVPRFGAWGTLASAGCVCTSLSLLFFPPPPAPGASSPLSEYSSFYLPSWLGQSCWPSLLWCFCLVTRTFDPTCVAPCGPCVGLQQWVLRLPSSVLGTPAFRDQPSFCAFVPPHPPFFFPQCALKSVGSESSSGVCIRFCVPRERELCP